MKHQAAIVVVLRGRAGFVVITMDGNVRMFAVPADDLASIPVVEQINQQATYGRVGLKFKELASQDRRADEQVALRQIGSRVERQGQPRRARAGKAKELAHGELLQG